MIRERRREESDVQRLKCGVELGGIGSRARASANDEDRMRITSHRDCNNFKLK